MAYIVGLCGIDGSGKTTVANRLVDELRAQGIKAHYRHELDLPLLKFTMKLATLAMGRRRAAQVRAQTLLTKERNKSGVSAAYHTVVWIDSSVGYVLAKLRSGVVVYDRWPFDFLLQFRLRNYGNRLFKWLFGHFPRPDALVLLKVSPDVAYERKRAEPSHLHDSREFFQRSAALIDELEGLFRYDAVLSSEQPVDDVMCAVHALIEESVGRHTR